MNSKNGHRPVLIINLWTMATHWKTNIEEVVTGYRLNLVEEKFAGFLTKIREAGGEMIFVFKKTQTKEYNFANDMNDMYQSALDVINQIKMRKELDSLKTYYDKTMDSKWFQIPFNQAIMVVLTQVAQRFGKLYGMDTIDNRSSTFHVRLANETNAMAIIGLDTYYVFYEGAWKFWCNADLDMTRMIIRQYDKEKILSHLNLNAANASLFVTLAGGIYTTEENIRKIKSYFGSRPQEIFRSVSKFVNQQRFPLTDGSLRKIIQKFIGRFDEDVFNDFKRTMELMDPGVNPKIHCKIDDEIMELIKHDYPNLAEELLMNSVICISPVFLDIRLMEYYNKVNCNAITIFILAQLI